MVFSDPVFLLLFVPIALLAHRIALQHSEAAAQWVLILASLVFYSAWDVRWLPLLLGSIAVNLIIGRALIRDRRRWLFLLGLAANLAPLVIVKYAGWLTGGYLFSEIILPLGLSFYTFQQIGFLVDTYRGNVESVRTRHYVLFVTFFSQLIAGPICAHKAMIDQFRRRFSLTSEQVTLAIVLIAAGLFKKAVIADRLAPYADSLFNGSGVVTIYEAWVGSLAYTFQLLFDFAGYCEMAMGFALLFGYRVPVNFLSPYKARSVTEFWRRWHITLSTWLRDFIYIPLGGNRHGVARMYAALIATAFISGLWHGAGMTFVVWGLLHGFALAMEKAAVRADWSLPEKARLVLTFLFVSFAWVLFRAPSFDVAANVYASMLGVNGFTPPALFADIVAYTGPTLSSLTGFEAFTLAGLLWWVWTQPNVHEISLKPTRRLTAGVSAAMVLIMFSITQPSSFIYYNF